MDLPGRCREDRDIMTEDRERIIGENREKCICEPCPTYNECMRADESLLFCVAGRSADCTFEKKGCLCPACPVTQILALNGAYYCIRGTVQEHR